MNNPLFIISFLFIFCGLTSFLFGVKLSVDKYKEGIKDDVKTITEKSFKNAMPAIRFETDEALIIEYQGPGKYLLRKAN